MSRGRTNINLNTIIIISDLLQLQKFNLLNRKSHSETQGEQNFFITLRKTFVDIIIFTV